MSIIILEVFFKTNYKQQIVRSHHHFRHLMLHEGDIQAALRLYLCNGPCTFEISNIALETNV